jgi:hypothetical protein
MQYLAIHCVLRTTEANIDGLLLSLVQYPLLFAEAVEICILHVSAFKTLIHRNPAFIGNVRLMASQLQYQDLLEELSPELRTEVESARLSLFRLLYGRFGEMSLLQSFMSDALFGPFFLSLLCESGAVSFVLMEIRAYMSAALERNFQTGLYLFFDEMSRLLPDQCAVEVETRFFQSIHGTEHLTALFSVISRLLPVHMQKLDGSAHSKACIHIPDIPDRYRSTWAMNSSLIPCLLARDALAINA